MFGRDLLHVSGLCLALVGCGSDATLIATRWKYDAESDASPPGSGPERRVVVALKSGQGRIVTLNEENGTRVEDLPMIFPTAHAPVVTGTTIVIVSSIGKVVGYSFAGEQRFAVPETPLGVTGPLARANDGSLRVGTTSGRLLGFNADGSALFDVTVGGAITTRPAIENGGTTYVATDTGRVAGYEPDGQQIFDQTVNAPASGPSAANNILAVGELDGVSVFSTTGTLMYKHTRGARVVGTSFTRAGEIIAWGEDGVVEVLDPQLDRVKTTFTTDNATPVYVPVVEAANGKLGVIDNLGVAYLVDRSGTAQARVNYGGEPLREIAIGEIGFMFMTIGKSVRALDFNFQ